MLAPFLLIFFRIFEEEFTKVKTIKIDEKQIEHNGINKF